MGSIRNPQNGIAQTVNHPVQGIYHGKVSPEIRQHFNRPKHTTQEDKWHKEKISDNHNTVPCF